MKTKKPSAIVYNWKEKGTFTLQSDVYYEENLFEDVIVYSIPYEGKEIEDFSKYRPDLIFSEGSEIKFYDYQLSVRHINYEKYPDDNIIANDIICQSVFNSCRVLRPMFSIFTPTYKTGERILRTYESLKNQTFTNWEWIVVDDSPDELTYDILLDIVEKDFRVKLHKIYPITGGNVGLAKHRASMLCDGDWLVELDHDDALLSNALEVCNEAILKYPDAGFLYSDGAELYEDGESKYYDHDWSGNYYARSDNFFGFGYWGHSWINSDNKDFLSCHASEINPLTIRFNISMPNHVRMWERNLYHKIGGHSKNLPVADDLEIIIRSFLNTRFIHVKKTLYLQYNNRNSTVDNNSIDINRRARLIRDYYDKEIHKRIIELGFKDWNWDEEKQHSQKIQTRTTIRKFYEEEQVMNYIYE